MNEYQFYNIVYARQSVVTNSSLPHQDFIPSNLFAFMIYKCWPREVR